jgi:glycosyltransferase involved in cell wall biosynthesis
MKIYLKNLLKKFTYKIPYPFNSFILRAYEIFFSYKTYFGLPLEYRNIVAALNKSKISKTKKNKYNILFYHLTGLSSGGTEKFIQVIAKHLSKVDFNIFFMYSSIPRKISGNLRLDGRKNYLVDTEDEIHAKLIEFTYSSLENKYPFVIRDQKPTIYQVLQDNKIDLICTAGSGYSEFPINLIKDIPIVMINIFGSPSAQPNIRKQISISQTVDTAISHIIPQSKREIVYIQSENPKEEYKKLGIELRVKLGIPKESTVFGRIGRSYDGIFDPIGINAFENIVKKYPTSHYIIMSPPPILVKIVKERNIPNIHFLKPSSEEKDIWAFHFSLDTLAHFRLDGETFGLNIAESMLAGNSIITHKSHIWNAHLEYLDPSFSFIVEKDDVIDYSRAMETIINQTPEDRVKMSEQSKKTAQKFFLIEDNIGRIEQIFKDAIL